MFRHTVQVKCTKFTHWDPLCPQFVIHSQLGIFSRTNKQNSLKKQFFKVLSLLRWRMSLASAEVISQKFICLFKLMCQSLLYPR